MVELKLNFDSSPGNITASGVTAYNSFFIKKWLIDNVISWHTVVKNVCCIIIILMFSKY